jgi:hypothetical protein
LIAQKWAVPATTEIRAGRALTLLLNGAICNQGVIGTRKGRMQMEGGQFKKGVRQTTFRLNARCFYAVAVLADFFFFAIDVIGPRRKCIDLQMDQLF